MGVFEISPWSIGLVLNNGCYYKAVRCTVIEALKKNIIKAIIKEMFLKVKNLSLILYLLNGYVPVPNENENIIGT